MKKIRVLEIISNMGSGGAQKIILNYLSDFKNDNNLDLKLLVLEPKTNSIYEKELEERKYNVKYLNLKKITIPFFHRFKNFNFYDREISAAINDYNPDIIHIHLFGTLKEMGKSLSYCNSKTIFYTLHSNPERFIGLDLKIIKQSLKKYNIVPICLTEEQARIAQKHYGIKNYELIRNGIDCQEIEKNIISKKNARKKFKFTEDNFIMCTVGRLEKIKNYSLLLEIFNKVLEKNSKALLVFAGDGSEAQNLQIQAQNLKIDDKVVFLGNIKNCVDLYCASDVFVLTSISESSSLVSLEAQICNTRCVISNGVPSESIITNKVKKMEENASLNDWVDALLDDQYLGSSVLSVEDYEVHSVSKKMKNLYLKYMEGKNDK